MLYTWGWTLSIHTFYISLYTLIIDEGFEWWKQWRVVICDSGVVEIA